MMDANSNGMNPNAGGRGCRVDGEAVLDERALIRATVAGQRECFESLVDRHQTAAFRFALKLLGDEDDAREACIVAFGNAYRALARFDCQASFKTWYFRILINQCRSVQRQRGRDLRRHVSEDLLPDQWEPADTTPAADPRRAAADEELEGRIRDAVDRLPDRFRVPWLLYACEGMSIAEVADVCRLSPGTVKSRLFHGRRKLARRLAPYVEMEQKR